MSRSRTDPGAPGRCLRCLVMATHCVCAAVPVVWTDTEIVILRHALETVRSTNTGRIAALALGRCRLVQVGGRGDEGHDLAFEDAALLFPGGAPLVQRPKRIVVLDATWPQARRMAQRMPGVRGLPRMGVPPRQAALRLRVPPRPGQMSTLEAIASAIAALEGEEKAAPLFALHQLHARSVLQARGDVLTSPPG